MDALLGTLITARIDALAVGGACIGVVIDGPEGLKGKKALVPGTVPGEIVEAQIERDEPRLVHARLHTIRETVPSRVTPPCPYYGVCGGCDFQHIELRAQREGKRSLVQSMLRKHGGVDIEVSVRGAELPGYGYRRRIDLHVSLAGEIGFFRAGSGEVVSIARCLLAIDPINALIAKVAPLVKTRAKEIAGVRLEHHAGEDFVVVKLRELASPFGRKYARDEAFRPFIDGFGNLTVVELGKKVYCQVNFNEAGADLPAGHFSQVNEAGNTILIDLVCAAVTSPEVIDLYAGSGNFSLPLAQRGKNVFAVEVDGALVEYGATLARTLNLSDRIKYFRGSCESFVKKHPLRGTIVLDPPRSGARALLDSFSVKAVDTIVYVSCNLPTLTRDLKDLRSRGFTVKSVDVVDMFSQTHHVETVSVLSA